MLRIVCVAAVSSVLASSAVASPISSETKLLASDGDAFDEFGFSTAVSEALAIVGARNGGADGSGAVYVFETATGSFTDILQSSDGEAGDEFGRSVAVDGSSVVVGSPFDDDSGSASGSVYVFDGATGTQLHKLTAADAAAGDRFGFSVAASDGLAIVGSQLDDDGASGSGSAYVFDTASGAQLRKLTAVDAAAQDQFGFSVGIDGLTAVVGARLDDDNGINSGSAYVFDVASGAQTQKLLADDSAAGDWFGRSVAVSGDVAIVGANGHDALGNNSGAAYLFDTTTGAQIAKLQAEDGGANDHFGRTVSIAGGYAIVGALYDDDNGSQSGAAYLFDVTTGSQIAKLVPGDGSAGDSYGVSVALTDVAVLIGTHGDDDNGTSSGSAYLYTASFENQVANAGEIIPNPLPAGFWLIATGMLALLGLRRRRA